MFINQRTKIIVSVFNILLISIALSACSKSKDINDKTDTYYQSADIQTITPSTYYEVPHEYIGKVSSKQFSSLSFEYGGKIEKVYVDSGDLVKKGQLLAEFNTELLKIKRQEIDASIRQLAAQAQLNKLNLARINELNAKGYSSKQTLDELETEKKVINADLSRQQANKSTVIYQIAKSKLHAPFDAIVSSRFVAEGEIFNSNQIAFELIKNTHYEITVGVPVKVARDLSKGQKLEVTLEQEQLSAKILVIGKQVNQISRTVELRLAINEQPTFYNGQLAKIKITQKVEQAGFWLPISALTDGIRGQWNIFRVQNTEISLFKIIATTVEVKYSTLDAVYIAGLPQEQLQVILAGVHRYVPGQLVKKSQKASNQTAKVGSSL